MKKEVELVRVERPQQKTVIAVFADTHGRERSFVHAIEQASSISNGFDLAIHLGDCVKDINTFERIHPNIPCYFVRGNNDYDQVGVSEEIILAVNDLRIYCTHGHRFPYSSRMMRLYYRAEELESCMALFGHTHSFLNSRQGNIDIVNPGSVSYPRDGSRGTFALLEISNGVARAAIHELSRS